MTAATTLKFHTFNVTRQAFYRSSTSFGIVNLKPLVPGHVLICPTRCVSRLQDLSADEVSDLFLSVQKVGKVIEKVYQGQALTISCQDGTASGQSVPHVHVHIMPRRTTDFNGNNDSVYPALEQNEHSLQSDLDELKSRPGHSTRQVLQVPKDEDRKPRSEEEMEKEAQWLSTFFQSTT